MKVTHKNDTILLDKGSILVCLVDNEQSKISWFINDTLLGIYVLPKHTLLHFTNYSRPKPGEYLIRLCDTQKYELLVK
jgi:hypothetical protein